MLEIADRFAGSLHMPVGWRAAGLALAAGILLGGAAPLPAAAQTSSGWREGCVFRTVPQSNGESLRYANCMRQQDCQNLANAAGRTVFEAGCFGVSPEFPAAAGPGALYRR